MAIQQGQPNEAVVQIRNPQRPFGGLKSAYQSSSLHIDEFFMVLNWYPVNDRKWRTRKGSRVFIETAFSSKVRELVSYKIGATQYYLFILENGKLVKSTTALGDTPVLVATLNNTNITKANAVVFKDKVFIADGEDAYSFDGTTLSTITPDFPVIVGGPGNVLFVIKTKSRVFFGTDNDWMIGSVPNDPTDFTTEANGSWKVEVSPYDSMTLISATNWGDTILINKGNADTGQYAMYWLRGTGAEADPFHIEALFGDSRNPTSFVGKSAVQVGNEVIGLTNSGFNTISAIQNYKEAETENLSVDIRDVIGRINWTYAEKVTAIYDPFNHLYLCAVPLDGASENNFIIGLDTIGYRWFLWNNWDVCSFTLNQGLVFYGSSDGKLIQTNYGDNDRGTGYTKQLRSGDETFDSRDSLKLLKSLALDVEILGDYSLGVQLYVDGERLFTTPIDLPLLDISSVWGVFKWDIDKWDGSGSKLYRTLINTRGHQVSYELINTEANQAFSFYGGVYHLIKKGTVAGEPQLN